MTVRIAILVVSDSVHAGTYPDGSGAVIAKWYGEKTNYQVTERAVVPDEEPEIAQQLQIWVDKRIADVILTTGGTGFSSRDVTPEATRLVITREAPGIAEAIRALVQPRVPNAMLSRGIAGIAEQILIVNLPGSTSGVRDGLGVLDRVLDHAVKILRDETGH